jgi:cytochrome d ubiquinol oxidase subunit II
MFASLTLLKGIGLVGAVAALLFTAVMVLMARYGRAFVGTSLTIAMTVVLLFSTLYPRVMPSSLGSTFDLTIYNASSSQYTLQVMTVIALICVPFVLAYQAWTYWVFRKRLTADTPLEY